MTQVQQAESDNSKVAPEVKKRGPKPKNAVNTTAGNKPELKPHIEEKGTEQSPGVISSSQTELQSSTESVSNDSPETSNPKGEGSGDVADQPGAENNQGQQAQEVISGGDAAPNQSGDELANNNENIVVHKTAKTDVKPKKGLIVKVKNIGLKAVYEPHSKVSIEPGDEGTIIECANHADLKSVLANIDQLNALGKKMKVVNDE